MAVLLPGKKPGTHLRDSRWVIGPFWTGRENLALTGIRYPELPVCSNPLYRLSYPGPHGIVYKGADKSLARPTSRCILFDGVNISFDASLVIYINSTNIPPIMIINSMQEYKKFLSL